MRNPFKKELCYIYSVNSQQRIYGKNAKAEPGNSDLPTISWSVSLSQSSWKQTGRLMSGLGPLGMTQLS